MSANNWTQCPRCAATEKAKAERLRAEADDQYGKVPAERWKQMDADARKAQVLVESDPGPDGYTLREDYELGIVNGEFYVRYQAGCSDCDFSYSFTIEEPLTKGGKDV